MSLGFKLEEWEWKREAELDQCGAHWTATRLMKFYAKSQDLSELVNSPSFKDSVEEGRK